MRIKNIVTTVFLMLIPAAIMAQDISREEFRNEEWRMKSLYWEKLHQRQNDPTILDQSDYDVKYWEVTIDVTDIGGQSITGKVIMTSQSVINGLSSIDYDLHSAMDVDSVKLNGDPAGYAHNGNTLAITLDRVYNVGESFTTIVTYGGHPPGGGFGSFTWDTHNGQPIISTLSEPEGSREWWPCKDQPHDKADSADVYIIVPDNLVGTSNGILVTNQDNGDGTRTFHWHISYPITTYLTCLAASNYSSIADWYIRANGDSMPVTHYVYPEHYNQAVTDLSITPAAIGIYASLFGEYPFIREKYGHSIFPWGGAMEHQCNTFYGSSLIRGDHSYDWILVHELSHQWFGDMITCDIWPDIWMNEGFASYCEALYTERISGLNAYLNYMRTNNGVYDPSGPIYDPDPLFDGNTVYNKGSWVLHMLRGVMGDTAFFQGMYSYANNPDHMYGTITTRQFQGIMEQFYGADLGWFFDEWVWGQNRPQYRYSWLKQDLGNGQYEVFLHIRQTQTSPAPNIFTMPIKIYPRIGGVDSIVTVWNDGRIRDYRFLVNGNPTSLSIDKNNWILREATSESYRMNIVTTSLPGGLLGVDYNQRIEVRGGIPPYHFSLFSGQLPTGLVLNSDSGTVSGVPTALGDFAFTIRCTDSTNPQLTDDQDYTVTIQQVDGVNDEIVNTPTEFMLMGNYPNPFNSSTMIRLNLPVSGNVRIDIFDIMGQQVQALYDGYMNAGENDVVWDGSDISSGIYFYRVVSGERSATRRMIMIK